IRCARIEVGEMVVTLLKRSLVFPTDAQVHGEVAGDLPIVLQIPVVAGLQQRERRSDGKLPPGGRAQQSGGHAVAGGGGCRGRVGSLSVRSGEPEVARRIIRTERVEL